MDPSTTLYLTTKGADEIAHRTMRLGIKPRSVLLLLTHPQTIEFVLQKSVFPDGDILETIDTLVQTGFIALVEEASRPAPPANEAVVAAPVPTRCESAPVVTGDFSLDEEINLPEARFLLIDFCVDCFGMQAEALGEAIRNSKSVGALRVELTELQGMVNARKPEQRDALREIVRAINATA